MDPLVRATLRFRKIARMSTGVVLNLALAAFVVFGGPNSSPISFAIAASAWGALLVHRLRVKVTRTGEAPLLVDFEVGALLSTGLAFGLLKVDGSLSGTFSPALYVLVALVCALTRPFAGLLVVGWMIGLEVAIRSFSFHDVDARAIGTHAFFAVTFALLHLAFLRAEVARTRTTAESRVAEELDRLKEDARRYRLLGAGEAREKDEQDRLARSSVEEIHQSVHYALELLRKTLNLHTAVLLWCNDAGTHLRISELSSGSDEIHDAPFSVGEGVLAAVIAKREAVALANLKPSYKVPYYQGGCPVRVLLAIPVMEGEIVRGVLAIDRTDNDAFSPHEAELASQAARYCLRAIQNERVFVQLERAKVEQGKLYRAAQALGQALTEKEVLDAGVRAAREIASFDLAAVTMFDDKTKTHEVCAATSDGGEVDGLVGAKWSHNAGLVSMVVQNRFPLPYKGDFDAARQVVLSKRFPWPKLPSLLVLPLLIRDKPLGTLILGAKRRHAFGDAVRPTLEVLASHLAVSLSNARMVHKLETMATTDGLTGLFNKRAMLDAADQKIAAAARFGRKLSLLVVDIDFFKKVNDTYGHDVGDVVIRGLGDVLTRQKRNTDVVARFGGEEFVVLCEQTDETGAMLLAERIREELGQCKFHAETGSFGVTCSIGVATFPDSGRDWESLFKAADEALYASKRGGRNRTTLHQPRHSEMRVTAPHSAVKRPKVS